MTASLFPTPLVKICGLRKPAHARAAADAGASFAGVVFAESKRRVTETEARAVRAVLGPRLELVDTGAAAIASAVESAVRTAARPLLVGVFAGQSADEINHLAAAVDLDLIQLSGGEHPALAARLIRPVLRAVHVRSDASAESIRVEIDKAPGALPLLDTHSDLGGGFGGTFDWDIAAPIARARICMLAGGLTPENVGDAVRRVRPWALDVSSGVETDGRKDPGKIRAFIDAVRAAAGAGVGGAA